MPGPAGEYAKVTDAVEARYRSTDALPADAAGAHTRRLAAEAHQRLLGNRTAPGRWHSTVSSRASANDAASSNPVEGGEPMASFS
jgi:hypothetical protein